MVLVHSCSGRIMSFSPATNSCFCVSDRAFVTLLSTGQHCTACASDLSFFVPCQNRSQFRSKCSEFEEKACSNHCLTICLQFSWSAGFLNDPTKGENSGLIKMVVVVMVFMMVVMLMPLHHLSQSSFIEQHTGQVLHLLLLHHRPR